MKRGEGYGAAMAGAAIGVVGGGACTFVVALGFRPASHEGWEDLGWSIYTLLACAAVGLVAGTVGTYVALRRIDADGAALTAGSFVVLAPLLAVGGPLLIVAPLAARWMALGFLSWQGRTDGGPSDPVGRRLRRTSPRGGAVPQRMVLWTVVSALGVVLVTNTLGYDLGGRVGGTAMVWAAASVVPAVAGYILWRAIPWPVVVVLVVSVIGAAGFAAQWSTREAHPTPQRLAEMGRELVVPQGQRVVRRVSASTPGSPPQPVEVIQSSAGGSTPPLPAPLTPGLDGVLPAAALVLDAPPAPSAREAASRWTDSLRGEGWRESQVAPRAGTIRLCRLPQPADDFVAANAQQVFARGLWQRAVVIPFETGAIVLLCTRP